MSSSSLPTTFSPGLFYLEALDYAGFDEKCKIDEVFNFISTSSEFMNSAILPQFIMKREYVFDIADAQLPFLFCNSLQFVRNVNIGPEYARARNEDDEDFPIKIILFLDFLESAGLFNFYTRELRLRYSVLSSEKNCDTQAKANQYFQLVQKCNYLESLSLLVAEDRSGFELVPFIFDSCANSLRKLELRLHSYSSAATSRGNPTIDVLQKLTNLEELTLVNKRRGLNISPQEILSLDWLTPDLPLCRSLKSLKLNLLSIIIPSFLPFSNFSSLQSLEISEDDVLGRNGNFPTPGDFGRICSSTARTLTSLKLVSVPLERGHFKHLKKLTNLRFLDITGARGSSNLLDVVQQLPFVDILLELQLSCFNVPSDQTTQVEDYCRAMFSKMKCIEVLSFSSIRGAGSTLLASLDHLPRQAPLRELRWDFSMCREEEVCPLPQSSLESVRRLFLYGVDGCPRTDQQKQELARMPIVFPNVISLDVDELPPVQSPFRHLQRLSLELCVPDCALRHSIFNNMFPQLQELDASSSRLHSVEAVLLCKELMKLKDFRKCHLGSAFRKAKFAHFVRSFCPFVNYDLSRDEKLEEWKYYRGRVRFSDSDDDYDNNYVPDDESECSGSRRQRSE